jgi:VWFA-related protein
LPVQPFLRRCFARSVTTAIAAAILLIASSPAPHGQESGQQPDPPPQFRTGTNLVRVDVTVVDGRGNPVTSLTADDFEVLDDGQRQSITSFKLIEATGQATDEQSLPIRSPQHAAVEAAKDDVRVFLIFWDDYHIGQFGSALRARDDLTRIVLGAFGPADLVAIMDPLTTLDAIRFTRDRRQLAEQVHQLRGRRGVYIPPRSGVEEVHLMTPARIEQIRCQVTESAVKAGAAHLGTLREGPSAMLVVTEGFGPCGAPQDEPRRLTDLIRVANGSHTAIFVADPRGLEVQRSGISMFLQSLASGTGGGAFQTNDLGVVFKRAVAQASAFYLLGYPKEMPADGKFHPIKVRVKRRGLEVRSRTGYWAPLAVDVEHARATAAAAEVRPAVAEALARLPAADVPRAVDVWTGTTPLENGRTAVTVAWTARRQTSNPEHLPVAVSVVATADREAIFQGPVSIGGTSFEAPPGPLQLAIAMTDAAGEVVDREQRLLQVPDPANTRLALSTPVVFRARTLKESREPRLPVHAGREFERTDRVLIRFVTFGAAREDEAVTATLLSRTGTALTRLYPRPDLVVGRYLLELPLTSIAPGEFIVSIEATRGDERAESLVGFRIVR